MTPQEIQDRNFDQLAFPHAEQIVVSMENFEYYCVANNIIFCAEYDDGTTRETLYKYIFINTNAPFFTKLTTLLQFILFYWR